MSRNNTGNPIGSKAFPDFEDNVKNLDESVNSDELEWVDRFGQSRRTLAGVDVAVAEVEAAAAVALDETIPNIIQDIDNEASASLDAKELIWEDRFQSGQDSRETRFNDFIASSGYQFVGDYALGIEITEYNQLIRDSNGEFWRVSGQVDLPYVTTGAGIPEDDALVPAGDAVLRQDLVNATDPERGAGMVGRGMVVARSVDELLSSPRKSDIRVFVSGYHEVGSGVGDVIAEWDADSTLADNGINVFAVAGVATGRWIVRDVRSVPTTAVLQALEASVITTTNVSCQGLVYSLTLGDYSAEVAADGVGYFVRATGYDTTSAAWIADLSGGLNLRKFGWDVTGTISASDVLEKAIALQSLLHSDGYGIEIDGGNLLLSSVVDIDNGARPVFNFTGNTSIIVNNAVAGFRIGDTAAAQLDISGQHPVFTQGGSGAGGVGIKVVRGGFNLPGLRGFDTDNYILDASAAAANAITNSSVGDCKFTSCGGIKLHNPTRGSLEVTIGDINASEMTTEIFSFENVTDVTTGGLIGDTAVTAAVDAVSIHNCGSILGGKWLITARNGRPVSITGNANSYTGTSSGIMVDSIFSLGSSQEMYLNCKRSQFGKITARQHLAGGMRFGTFMEGCDIGSLILVDGSQVTPSVALDVDTLSVNHIGSLYTESLSDSASIDISAGSNRLAIGVLMRAVATSVWANGNRPKYFGESFAPEYVYKNSAANQTIVGAAAGPFNIPHGLVGTPTRFSVVCGNNAVAYRVTANATNLQVTFASSVTDPSFTWEAKMF